MTYKQQYKWHLLYTHKLLGVSMILTLKQKDEDLTYKVGGHVEFVKLVSGLQ